MAPADRKYTKTHEWIKLDGGTASVGISDHAQHALGDLTFVEPPDEDATLEQADECGVIESVKAATDLCAPVSGTVTEVNDALASSPELVNSDPYSDGWIFKMTVADPHQLDNLLSASEYESFLED